MRLFISLLKLCLLVLVIVIMSLLSYQFSFAQEQPDSPLKQFERGISPLEIKCAEGYQLILKTSDDSSACVWPSSAITLFKRGWGVPIPNNVTTTSEPSNTKPNSVFAMFYISGSNAANLRLFEKYLRPGDYLFITTPLDQDSNFSQVLQDTAQAKKVVHLLK